MNVARSMLISEAVRTSPIQIFPGATASAPGMKPEGTAARRETLPLPEVSTSTKPRPPSSLKLPPQVR